MAKHIGVKIGNKHSWTHWKLWMLNKPEISPPEPKYMFVDIAGADGSLDLTESLTGTVQYESRKIKMELNLIDRINQWAAIYSEIMNYCHGKSLHITFDDDIGYYYTGRISVNQWKSSRLRGIITIEAIVDPYKYEVVASNEPWKWDPFSFVDGVIRNYSGIEVNGTKEVTVIGSRKELTPVISCSASGMSVTIFGETYPLESGRNAIPQIILTEGEHTWRFSGTGTVEIIFRGGSL